MSLRRASTLSLFLLGVIFSGACVPTSIPNGCEQPDCLANGNGNENTANDNSLNANSSNDNDNSAGHCASDAQCDDGVFCNGSEFCLDGTCVAGMPPCPAGSPCDESGDACVQNSGPDPLSLSSSRLIGGSGEDTIRDIFLSSEGGYVVAGGTASNGMPLGQAAAVFSTTLDTSGSPVHDVYVARFEADGTLAWGTYLGGPDYDRAYAVEVDGAGYVYVAGRAGPGFPTTAGTLQEAFAGDDDPNGLYGEQDGFVAKLTPDGASLLWATYFGDAGRGFIRDIALAPGCPQDCEVYLAFTHAGPGVGHITPGAFDTTYNGATDGVVARISADGSEVIWASYLGGSSLDVGTPSIRVTSSGAVVVAGYTDSSDIPTTAGAFDRSYGGNGDLHVALFSPDGEELLFGTYLGESGVEFSETHCLAVDATDRIVVAATTKSALFPATAGAFQTAYGGSGGSGTGGATNYPGDGFVALLSADGSELVAATFLGGSHGEGIEGVGLDQLGNVYVAGATYSADFPTTLDAHQNQYAGGGDFFAAVLSPDLSSLVYATYLGGSGTDYGRCAAANDAGLFVVGGHSQSGNFPVEGVSPGLQGGNDGVIAFFSR